MANIHFKYKLPQWKQLCFYRQVSSQKLSWRLNWKWPWPSIWNLFRGRILVYILQSLWVKRVGFGRALPKPESDTGVGVGGDYNCQLCVFPSRESAQDMGDGLWRRGLYAIAVTAGESLRKFQFHEWRLYH